MGLLQKERVMQAVRQSKALFPQLTRRSVLRLIERQSPQTHKRREKLRAVTALLAERIGLPLHLRHFGSGMAFQHPEGYAYGELQGQLVLNALWSSREVLEDLQATREVSHRLDIGGALHSTLASALPVGHCLLRQAGFRIVMGEQFGLDIGDLGKLRRQHLSDPLMILLPRALQ
jgi:hypothetical protein